MHILSKKQAIYNYNFILFCNFKKLTIFNEFSGEGVLREINCFSFFFSVFFLFVLNITIALLDYFRNV